MFVPESYAVALLMMLGSMFCWGSWANSYKLTRNYRFELFYWDYAAGIFLVSIAFAFTLGQIGDAPDGFLNNVRTADRSNIAFALAGGFIFNIANLLLVAGIDMVGLAIAFPVAIGIALVVGVVFSYLVEPRGEPMMLAVGVALAILAVTLDGKAYGRLPAGTSPASRKGVGICVVSGLLMGAFAPFVTRALTSGQALTPYSIAVFFTLGAVLCCPIVNVYFMRHPLVGEPVDFSDYFHARPADHALGLFGGVVWGTGTVFNFVAAGLVGVTISYAIGQAAPMVAALWGVLVWKEFRRADRLATMYLIGMFVCYLLAIVLISQAYTAA